MLRLCNHVPICHSLAFLLLLAGAVMAALGQSAIPAASPVVTLDGAKQLDAGLGNAITGFISERTGSAVPAPSSAPLFFSPQPEVILSVGIQPVSVGNVNSLAEVLQSPARALKMPESVWSALPPMRTHSDDSWMIERRIVRSGSNAFLSITGRASEAGPNIAAGSAPNITSLMYSSGSTSQSCLDSQKGCASMTPSASDQLPMQLVPSSTVTASTFDSFQTAQVLARGTHPRRKVKQGLGSTTLSAQRQPSKQSKKPRPIF